MIKLFSAVHWNLLKNKQYYTSVLARYVLGGYTVHCMTGANWCSAACRQIARQMSTELTMLRVMNTATVERKNGGYIIVIKAA